MTVFVRDATVDDATAIADVHVHSWHEAYRGIISDSYLNEQMTLENGEVIWKTRLHQMEKKEEVSLFLVAETSEGVQGMALAHVDESDPKSFFLKCFYIHPRAWRQGIGTRLFHQVKEQAKALGFQKLKLGVLKDNLNGIAFYTAMGGWHTGDDMWNCMDGNTYPEERYEFSL